MFLETKKIIVHDIWFDDNKNKKQRKQLQTLICFKNKGFFTHGQTVFEVTEDFIAITQEHSTQYFQYYTHENISFSLVPLTIDETLNNDLFYELSSDITIKTFFHVHTQNAYASYDKNINIQINKDNNTLKMTRESGHFHGLTGLQLITMTHKYSHDMSESFGGYLTYIYDEEQRAWFESLKKKGHPIRVITTYLFEWLNGKNVDIVLTKLVEKKWQLNAKHDVMTSSLLLLNNNNHEGFTLHLNDVLRQVSHTSIENMWKRPLLNGYQSDFGIAFTHNTKAPMYDYEYRKMLKKFHKDPQCRACQLMSNCLSIEGSREQTITPTKSHCSIVHFIKK